MVSRGKFGKSIAVLALGWACAAAAQTAASRNVILSAGGAGTALNNPASIIRELDDPHLGTRWLLMRDPDHPGGPGLLSMASPAAANLPEALRPAAPDAASLSPVIRAGQRVIVEENSPVVEARLEAVALSPAILGGILEARLTIGGRVVRVTALGPGRVALQPASGVRP